MPWLGLCDIWVSRGKQTAARGVYRTGRGILVSVQEDGASAV